MAFIMRDEMWKYARRMEEVWVDADVALRFENYVNNYVAQL